jgi:hypothetical protein
VNVQAVRLALERDLPAYFPGWDVTLSMWPALNATKTVQIGHARTLGPDTFDSQTVDLPITLWVKEANQTEAVNDMYQAISYDTDTAVRRLVEARRVLQFTVEQVGRREEGPTGFIAADLLWIIQVADT